MEEKPSSDVAFTATVKATQLRRGSTRRLCQDGGTWRLPHEDYA